MINVVVLGAGFMGTMHCAAYARFRERVRVHTVCSRTLEKAVQLADRAEARASDDISGSINQSDVDLIDICLPTYLHRPAAEASFAAGKHVFLEKPIALTLSDADAILDAAATSDRQLVVGLTLRFWPEYRALKDHVQAGQLGRPLTVSTVRLSPPVDWNSWMRSSELSGGVAVDLLVHDFDQINWLLGIPRRVFAAGTASGSGELPPHIAATIAYDDATGIAEGSLSLPHGYPFSSALRVVCEHGAAEYRFEGGPAAEGNIAAGETATSILRVVADGQVLETRRFAPHDPWDPEIQSVIEGLERSRPPADGTGEQARTALAVAVAANRSLRSGAVEAVTG